MAEDGGQRKVEPKEGGTRMRGQKWQHLLEYCRNQFELGRFNKNTPLVIENYERARELGARAKPVSTRVRSLSPRFACEFGIHLDKGLSLSNLTNGQLHWEHPFEAIRATGDDGQQFMWIDFGEPGGEQEIDLHGSPKAIVFILHTFLATKVYQLGLYA